MASSHIAPGDATGHHDEALEGRSGLHHDLLDEGMDMDNPSLSLGGSGGVSGRISEEPDGAELRDSKQPIALFREPLTDDAQAFTQAVVDEILPAYRAGRSRPVGSKGRATLAGNVGLILGGLLWPHRRGERIVNARRRPGAGMWEASPVGRDVFWRIIDAMHRVGMVGQKLGGPRAEPFSELSGFPTRLWATARLSALAARHSIQPDNIAASWGIGRAVECVASYVKPESAVRLRALEGGAAIDPPEHHREAFERYRADIVRLNDMAQRATFTGCIRPAFRRSFRHNLQLGGRAYSVGWSGFQSMTEAERGRITIDGSPVVELDLSASFLSIFLALRGCALPPGADPYAAVVLPPEISRPRDVVKRWFVQTFGNGAPIGRWAQDTPKPIAATSWHAVRDAVVRAFPIFAEPITAILPPDLLRSLPPGWAEWAAGQYLVFRESEAVLGATFRLLDGGILALPMHDGIIVPAHAEEAARAALADACMASFGAVPRITS